ncbi:glycogen synthase [Gammaproteobacteria bacterium LSUCC0112]|nr:glycogen synthase [Gammaproteobacteria bacterium LSUCC0112]
MHIVMIAAENAALTAGKVGGIGDVIRDIPGALARQGHQVSVIIPAYQRLAHINDSLRLGEFTTVFAGKSETVSLYRVQPQHHRYNHPLVNHYLLDHPLLAPCGAGAIYCHDESGPFATDANKFAFFCTAVCDWLISDELHKPDVLHLHDWHAAMVSVLRHFHPRYQHLQTIHTVYTIHNLSLQGIRPLRGDHSSLERWHPYLVSDALWSTNSDALNMTDPRYADCINLMRCGLLLSDRVHAVSPGYAQEIQQPNDPQRAFVGGEGLEQDLQALASKNRLFGILNGCEYSDTPVDTQHRYLAVNAQRNRLFSLIDKSLKQWAGQHLTVPASFFHAACRLADWQRKRKPAPVCLVSIGRLTEQKVSLLYQPVPVHLRHHNVSESALSHLLSTLDDGILILIGTGDRVMEEFCTRMMMEHHNFLYLQGFSEELADLLYGVGDIFLMPSSFEPCGISQMLAMRAGVPCVVHRVGGLKDTVMHGVNGFTFGGNSQDAQVSEMLGCVAAAADMARSNNETWHAIRKNAASARFLWDDVLQDYVNKLYVV